ncbi:FAD-dependent oxidoreductase [Gimesia algae]|uniref:Putative FAD-binding dehydrogenase n=1 Tax=Gimesia algae TaxID=2527971 RepID=A0A517V8B4_9PLAN|nr:FAD-dependent oxidoreductase [Gimesia algae]QDT89250.1 putative FAD-binding dehydrogenase [Gimesia algae]
MKRRCFLQQCGIYGSGIFSLNFLHALESRSCSAAIPREQTADIVIIGAGLGGCAAALSACRNGARVILTEPTDWIGGQISQQAVPPDEHQWIETFGRTESYAKLRTLIRDYYKQYYPLTSKARKTLNLNPGNGSVSRICHEPKVGIAALQSMLAPAISSGQLTLLLNTQPRSAELSGDRITAVTCQTQGAGHPVALYGAYFIDASEEGDLLPLTKTEYVLGAESQSETGEPHAPEKANPQNIQSFTHCFAIDHQAGEDHTIERPAMYDFWKDHTPPLKPAWSGKLLSLAYSSPRTLEPKALSFVPCGKETPAPKTRSLNLWLYRRMIDRNNFTPGSYSSDITVINWPQNDYMLGNITDVSPAEREKHITAAKQLSLSLFYWLQTEAPRPDGGLGWPGLRLRRDITGTADGLAKYPYIRESRRIRAETTIKEQDLTHSERLKALGKDHKPLLAKPFPDTVGIGYYHLDLHPSSGGDNYIDMGSVPFQIPLGAMIPERVENLIPACKNIGTTHISNGCYRLHPVEWSIGEAAGVLCSHAITSQATPRQIRNTPQRLQEFQSTLTKQGLELEWSRLS